MKTTSLPQSNRAGVKFESLPISRRIDGTMMGIPVITLHGGNEGPCLLINCGTHGDEPEGHATLLQLVDSVDTSKLRGTIIGVAALNYPAYEQRSRGNPLDEWSYDMNRIFPGSASGTITNILAHRVVSEILPKADLVLDLHSGGNNIYVCERVIVPEFDDKNLRLAKAMGPGWELIAVGAGERSKIASFTSVAAQLGKPALTVELGGSSNRLPENFNRDVQVVFDAILNVLREYEMIEGTPTYADEWKLVEYEPLRSTSGGLLRYSPECVLKADVAGGTLLMTVVDVFGNVVEEIRAPYDLVIMSVPAQPFLSSGGVQVMTVGKVTRTMS